MILWFDYKFLISFVYRFKNNLAFISLFSWILIFWKSCTCRNQSSLFTFPSLSLNLNAILPDTCSIWRACRSSCLFLKYKIIFLKIYNLVCVLKVFSWRWRLTLFLYRFPHIYIVFNYTLIVVFRVICDNLNVLVQNRWVALVYSACSFKIIYFI